MHSRRRPQSDFGNTFDFQQEGRVAHGAAHGSSCGVLAFLEIGAIDFIHAGEIVGAGEDDIGLHHLVQAAAGFLQQDADVLHDLMHLRIEVSDRDLSIAKIWGLP